MNVSYEFERKMKDLVVARGPQFTLSADYKPGTEKTCSHYCVYPQPA